MKIIQYGHYDGIPTLRDSQVMGLYRQMVADGTADTVFYDGSVLSPEAFLRFIKSKCSVLLVAADDNQTPLGAGWLTGLKACSAECHFVIFSTVRGKARVDVGRSMLDYALAIKSEGEYRFEVLVGAIPNKNKSAVSFVKKCGAVVVGDIPGMVYDFLSGQIEDATLFYCQRR